MRTTLNRMAGRGLLQSLRQDRKTCFGLTPHAAKVLTDGGDRAWRTTGAVNRDWDGRWAVVGFSLPEAWSRERHDLRSRLLRAGFGHPQDGLRVAPARVDVREMVAGLGTEPGLRVLRAEAESPTDVREVLSRPSACRPSARGTGCSWSAGTAPTRCPRRRPSPVAWPDAGNGRPRAWLPGCSAP
ncbi:hypothetical protein [Streptomyces sp. NPDC048282]|uniref:hypothetical protein n=1 Tax=Streptomyces sp. NPDC048282 TaxID=3365528 RepID=UPI0037198C77